MKKDGHQWSSGDDHYACRSYQAQAGGGEEKIHCHKGGTNCHRGLSKLSIGIPKITIRDC